MKEIFSHYVEQSFGEKKQAEFKIQQFALNYLRYFPSDKDATVVDVGIGRGEMLSCMSAWGYHRYLGIDISPSTVEFCRSLDLNCRLIDDTMAWLAERPASIALITLLDVLEHIKKDDVIPLLQAIRSSLAEKGAVIIQVPNSQSPDSQLHRYNDITHATGYGEHSLTQVLLAAGFSDISFHAFEDVISSGLRRQIRIRLRSLYWSCVRTVRRITGNLNPEILSPVFYAVVRK